MNKAYTRIVWENYPSVVTPLNETNLNKVDLALDTVDDRIVEMDTTKADQEDLLGVLSNVTYDETTGEFVFTWKNGNTLSVDLNVEKIPTSFSMSSDGVITMTNADGTTYTADVSELIKTYTFENSSELTWSVTTDESGNKMVSAGIIDGSIGENKLQVNFLADCRAAKAGAESAKAVADEKSLVSEGYAVGTQNGVPVPVTSPYYQNNAKYYSDKAGGSALSGLSDVELEDLQSGDVLVYSPYSGTWYNTNDLYRISNGLPVNSVLTNLIPYPYTEGPFFSSGNFEVDEYSGRLTPKNTASSNVDYTLYEGPLLASIFPGRWYILSVNYPNVNGVDSYSPIDGIPATIKFYNQGTEVGSFVTRNGTIRFRLQAIADSMKIYVTFPGGVDFGNDGLSDLERYHLFPLLTYDQGKITGLFATNPNGGDIKVQPIKKSEYDAMPMHNPSTLYVFIPEE